METDVLFDDSYQSFRKVCCLRLNIRGELFYPIQNINVIWVGIYV